MFFYIGFCFKDFLYILNEPTLFISVIGSSQGLNFLHVVVWLTDEIEATCICLYLPVTMEPRVSCNLASHDNSSKMADNEPKFTFQLLSGKKFNSIENKDAQDYLMKWWVKVWCSDVHGVDVIVIIYVVKTVNVPLSMWICWIVVCLKLQVLASQVRSKSRLFSCSF